MKTRQVYNLFQDLWNNFPYFEGVPRLRRQTDKDRHHTYRTGNAYGAARNPSSVHFVGVIIWVI